MAGNGPAIDATASPSAIHSPERTEFAQDMLDSINAVAQQPAVEMQTMRSPSPTVADPPIDADREKKSNVPDTSSADQQEPSAPSALDGTASPQAGAAKPLPAIAPSGPAAANDGIGPATEGSAPADISSAPAGSQLVIMLLLPATDTRHPYVIDQAYLERRNVEIEGSDPTSINVYTLKELIMRDWRTEWEAKPASPSSIRLIHMGRMLEDKWYLKDARFTTGPTPHIVHMTVKPQEVIDEEDARMAKGGRDGAGGRGPCRCVIM